MRLGAVLKKWRFASEMDIRTAANHLGLSASALGRIEKGTVPDGETLIKLWNWLTTSEATNGTGENQQPTDSSGA
jgi:transcriptional regulator with XRE-family HTH domain